ncbi:MAG: hypothetical protein ABIQ32_08725 [Sphingomicrobium sp.]
MRGAHVIRVDPDRLPWLDDTASPTRRDGYEAVWLFLIAAVLGLAALSYFIGRNTVPEAVVAGAAGDATIDLPEAVAPKEIAAPPRVAEEASLARQQPVTRFTPQRQTKQRWRPLPAPSHELANSEPDDRPQQAESEAESPSIAEIRPAAPAAAQPQLVAAPPTIALPPVQNAARIGVFRTSRQAKVAWTRMVRVYPGITGLRAMVVPARSLRNGQIYYRLQFKTSSQAHSVVLCQRMRIIAQSCVAVSV